MKISRIALLFNLHIFCYKKIAQKSPQVSQAEKSGSELLAKVTFKMIEFVF
jgi:hypothetical protein